MSGFDLPPMLGFDRSFRPQGPGERAWPGEDALRGLEPGRIDPFERPVDGGDRGEGFDGVETARPFSGVLAESLEHVRSLQDASRDKVRGLLLGEDVELHEVMIAGSKSEVAFNLLLEVRNKMVDAWEKLSRSSV